MSDSTEVDARACSRDLDRLEDDIVVAAQNALRAAIAAALESARATTLYHDQTGTLRRETKSEFFASELTGRIGAGTTYARYVESGTEPHDISARGGGPFMQRAAAVGEQSLDYGLEYYVNGAIEAA